MNITLAAPLTSHDPKWRDHALCRFDTYPDLWHPDGTTSSQVLAQATEAKRICGLCPVQQTCLEAAMNREGAKGPGSRYGIHGGLDENERYKLHRRRAAKQATG